MVSERSMPETGLLVWHNKIAFPPVCYIKETMEESGLTGYEFAKILGTSISY